jgi:hypothetical protein
MTNENLPIIMAIVGIVTGLGGLLLSVWMYLDKRQNTQIAERAGSGDYLLDTNQAIVIANQRATAAEKERREAEIQHKAEIDALKRELVAVNKRLEAVEKALAYEIRLVAHLGDDPRIEAVSIKRIPANEKV